MRDLSRLLDQVEGQYFDRKSLWHGPVGERGPRKRREVRDQIAEYVAAFANADGGTLVLGIEDDGTVTGHDYPAEAIDDFLATPQRRLVPPLPPGERAQCQGHEILLFEVAAAERAVMVTGDGYPRRAHDQVILESEENINAIKARGRMESVEAEMASGATLDALDLELLSRAREGAGLGHLSSEEYLKERRLADMRGGELVLYKGAMLLFARRSRDIDHANAGVRIFTVRGNERLSGDQYNVEEAARIEGALPTVIEKAYETLNGLIRRSTRLHDLFFREVPEYPTFAWQEALVNAVAHRDYRIHGHGVEVWLYEDRMEVRNPGGLLPEVELARLKRRERLHASRNPRITRVLAELALMREQGEGIPRIFEEMERSWLRLPELEVDDLSFAVTLRNQPILETPDPDWVRHVQSLPIGQRQRRILVAYPRGSFTNGDYQALNEVDRDAAYRELKEMVDLGLVSAPESRGRGARYKILGLSQRDQPTVTPYQSIAARMDQKGHIQNADYREIFDVERGQARQVLGQLVETGVLVRSGTRRGTRYSPGQAWKTWLRNSSHNKGQK